MHIAESKNQRVVLTPIGDRQYNFAPLSAGENFEFLGTKVMEKYKFNSAGYADMSDSQRQEVLDTITSSDRTDYSYSFKVQLPVAEQASSANNSSVTVSNYSITSFYNYYAKQYEEVMGNSPAIDAPNCYVGLKNGTLDSDTPKRHFDGKRITKASFQKIITKYKRDFFPRDQSIINSTRNMIFTKNHNPVISSFIHQFPFGIRVAFDHYHNNTEFINTFKKLDMLDILMSNYESINKFKLKVNVDNNW